METLPQTIARLLGALEVLTREEHLLIEHGFFSEAIAVQAREAPLVARIAELLREPGAAASLDHELRQRAQRLIASQHAQSQRLAASIDETRGHLDQLRSAHTRAQKLRPSYGAAIAAPATLSFAGEA